jgi:CubicO group peptidase (beta-lactamase class C family)
MTYYPAQDNQWETVSAAQAGFNEARLNQAVGFAEQHESSWPRDLEQAGAVPGLSQFEKPPWDQALGPFKSRGGSNGLLLKGGRIAARWGDPGRVEMTFSIAKSYLSILTGIALGDKLIADVDAPVKDSVAGEYFSSTQNSTITWRHLLNQTSEWEGTLWDKPDLVDRNRRVGPGTDNSRKGEHRDLQAPGSFWEYNDVRVNLLALSLLQVFREPLPNVLKTRVMDPIGCTDSWSWHGYRNSFVDIDGQSMQSVPGGTHWGGGIQINSFDHARLALLVHRGGLWNQHQYLPEGWTQALRTACPIEPGYGFLWWLNTNQHEWPGVPESSYAALGAGNHILWIDPDHDLVLVARWIEQEHITGLLAKFVAALE